MKAISKKYKTVEEYLATQPENIKIILEKLRYAIRQAAPKAEEVISYNMPAFKLDGMLVFYAACKAHIGFYPASSVVKIFENDLKAYETSKGAIRLPIGRALPIGLIKKIVKHRVRENMEKAKTKAQKKKLKA